MRFLLPVLCGAWLTPLSAQPAKVDFLREIRPLLSENCFQCHGPDAGTRMADLRLDTKQSAFTTRKSGAIIAAGRPADSLLYQRMVEKAPARRMPPPYSHKSLTPTQVARVKAWIEQGAVWKEPWAYQPPVKTALPSVRNAPWATHPIDRFILAKLEAKGLTPAPVASKRTLLRRVALDLTGLPPTPAEIDAFLNDTAPNAYEKMIDRYLASPHYGEHRARYWLDAARYGDTHGIHVDNYREIWPYRDWVIQAFNRNLPYNQFSIEQLAGDLLPGATLDQRIATGFVRSGVSTNEAGIIEDEYAEIYAKDRVETVSAIYLGLTTGCATCHDHKFDPITQKDFYSLGAFFRNTTQKVMDDNVPDSPPVVVVPREEDRESWTRANARRAELRAAMTQTAASADAAFTQWLATRPTAPAAPLAGTSEIFTADLAKLAATKPGLAWKSEALHFEKDGVDVPTAPKLEAEKPFSISVGFYFPAAEQPYTVAAHNNPREKNRGWVVDVGARVAGFRLVGDGGRQIEIRAGHLHQLKHGSWNHIVVTYDGSRHQKGLGFYLNGSTIPTQGRGNQNVEIAGDIAVDAPLTLGRSLPGGAINDLRIFNREVTESEVKLLAQWTAVRAALSNPTNQASHEALKTYFLLREHQPYQKLIAEQDEANATARAIARRGAISLVMEERTDTQPHAWILNRGAYDQRRQQVGAETPSVLPPMRASMPRNRLGLAEWLFQPEHPLTARVAVNRVWQEIFGIGLSKTTDDFGSQGEPPTHQELLDWLAVDLRENNWDLKRLYKQILLSATYRQSAQVTPAKLEADPENRLLSRAARFRLDGETVRDYALAASGLLARQIGGPSVKPYQPEGVWEAVAMIGSNTRFYKPDPGDGLYRRSLYTFWKRSAPPAAMDIFNAPTREACTVRRERTNTPLQALVTMNDVQFVEAARELAGRAMQNSAAWDAQLDYIALRLLARPLTLAEKNIARQSFAKFQSFYAAHEKEARAFLREGERQPDPSLAQASYAAMTMLTSQLMNLDEVLNK